MELVANIWPIIDEPSGLIQRFAVRAYALEGTDAEIAATLKKLAPADYAVARHFAIPEEFKYVTEHGTLLGTVTPAAFNLYQATIVEHALRVLEHDLPTVPGIGMDSSGNPFLNKVPLSFPKEFYFVVTYLMEDQQGRLRLAQTPSYAHSA